MGKEGKTMGKDGKIWEDPSINGGFNRKSKRTMVVCSLENHR